jgi:hypothetical protein
MKAQWDASRGPSNVAPPTLYPREIPGIHYIGGGVDQRTVPDVIENIAEHRSSNPEPSSS